MMNTITSQLTLLQGVGFNITCQLMPYTYDIHVGHIFHENTPYGDRKSCYVDSEIASMVGEHASMITFAIQPIPLVFDGDIYDFNITTKFRNDTACKGLAFTQTCSLHQGIVEYSVILQDSSISLRYPHWQNDSFLNDLPKALPNNASSSSDLRTRVASWNQAFMNLYKPVKFNTSRYYCDGEPVGSILLTNCQDQMVNFSSDAMECIYYTGNSPMTFRDSMDFEIENVNNKNCGRTWRNPMQVILFSPFFRSS